VTLFEPAPDNGHNAEREHVAARLSRLLYAARESIEMWADTVEARVHRVDRHNRRLVAEIDEFRREQGWGPKEEGFVGFGGEPDVGIWDGYHTHAELYAHRVALFAALARSHPSLAWRSKLHHDGSSLEGWFIAGMALPTGPVTYRAPLDAWAEFGGVATLPRAPAWDGHNAEQVLDRLRRWRPGAPVRVCDVCGELVDPDDQQVTKIDDGPAFPLRWQHKRCS
jgi:hypothetical protein